MSLVKKGTDIKPLFVSLVKKGTDIKPLCIISKEMHEHKTTICIIGKERHGQNIIVCVIGKKRHKYCSYDICKENHKHWPKKGMNRKSMFVSLVKKAHCYVLDISFMV